VNLTGWDERALPSPLGVKTAALPQHPQTGIPFDFGFEQGLLLLIGEAAKT